MTLALSRRLFALCCLAVATLGVAGCEDLGAKSAKLAEGHVAFLVDAAKADVADVRTGLPKGAKLLVPVFEEASPELPNPQVAREGLRVARDKVQDLRVAKSTFFAVTSPEGKILRNDQEQDDMVGKLLFTSYPELKTALSKGYVEARGSMTEAAGVRGRDDAQWVAAAAVQVAGEARGLYVTGWSWSAYAYRLETAIRSQVLSQTESGDKVPLLYVYVIVDKDAYGAPVAPMINARAIMKLDPLAKTPDGGVWSSPLEIDGRRFGVAVRKVPELGSGVAIAVLRSET